MTLLLVAARVLANAWANVLQKRLTLDRLDPLLIVAVSFVVLAVLSVPMLYAVPLTGLTLAFWGIMACSALFDTPGNILLVQSVRLTDLSLIGPLNAYKPIVAMVLGIFVVGEVPDAQGLLGVGVIVAGSLFLSPSGERAGLKALAALARNRGVQFRVLSLVMTATAAIILKAALVQSTPMQTFIAWAFVNVPVAVVCWLFLAKTTPAAARQQVQHHAGRLFFVAVLFLLMQVFTLQLFARMQVSYALALFQLSALVNVFFGYKLFQEQHILQRAVGSAIMIVGAVILILGA